MITASTAAALATFALLWWAQVAVPGPNFVRITNAALLGSRSAAMSTAAGVATGNAMWCVIALSGAAIFQQHPELRQIIACVGAAYFAWLGAKMLHRAVTRRPTTTSCTRCGLRQPDLPAGLHQRQPEPDVPPVSH
ncbi:LysE family translocator, partial [Brevundimonas naejangsanensis]|uniref:LysE family translocator n=1 Tax=Brevundimonas naejangsanensis TaxID=588932 RepID=UPI0026E922B9